MQVVSFAYAKRHLRKVCNQAEKNRDITVIARKNDPKGQKAIVLMSLSTYNELMDAMRRISNRTV
ncbi:type II toxin-antitoxin system Phd/YefM family antitoxin [Dyella sp. C9]|uniref:type II toxin-antitoxin system Phd/YefM family antitoxin n=1 Tax=Dyella sp. C9 TaxID=2202154 RepID=UPI000DEFC55B